MNKRIFKYRDYLFDYLNYYFSKKIEPNFSNVLLDEIICFLINKLVSQILHIEDNIYAFPTKMRSKKSYNISAQARMIIILCKYGYTKNEEIDRIIKGIDLYIEKSKEPNGLFNYHNREYYPKDEGIPTYHVLLSKVFLYETYQEAKYLFSAIEIAENIRKHLYFPEYGYLHTLGQKMWCTNASALAIYVFAKLFHLTNNEKYLKWIDDGLKIIKKASRKDGFFSYSEKNRDVYIYSYHNITLFYLTSILDSIPNFRKDIQIVTVHKSALNALINLIDNEISFKEVNSNYTYLISIITAYAALIKNFEKDRASKLVAEISKFIKNEKVYFYLKNNKLIYGPNNRYEDILLTEILFWLIIE